MQNGDGNDIRSDVEDNRSILKKIQLLVPGFSGYREKEDIRIADQLLRSQVSGIFHNCIGILGNMRQSLSQCFKMPNLMGIADLISLLQALDGDILHAEQGYSGFAAPIKIRDSNLDRMYDFDFSFINSGHEIANLLGTNTDPCSMDDKELSSILARSKSLALQCRESWSHRLEEIEKIRVK